MRIFWRLLGRSLWRDERGNMAMLFGLVMIPIIGIVGLAVDTARAYAVQEQLQAGLDAASLAGGRYYSLPERDAIIQDYFDQNWDATRYGATVSPLTITPDNATGTLTIAAEATFSPIFVKFLGVGNIDVEADSQITRNETTLEVALAIDTTGSMDQNDGSGTHKMTAAIDAANLLLNILYNDQDSDDKVFVSVVPFVQNVNVGNNYGSWLVAGSEAAVPWNSGPYPSSGWRGCMFERLNGSNVPVYDTTDESPVVQRFRPYADDYIGPNCPAWTSGERGVFIGLCRQNNGSIYTATTAGTAGATAPIHLSGTASDGTVTWQYRRPAFTSALGTTRIDCPIWQRDEAVTTNSCRTAPICPTWQSSEAIGIGACRVSSASGSARIYSATSAGTTSGASGPSHTSGSATSGGITWQHRGTSYAGIGNNIYFATGNGTTGNLAPVHTTGSTSDGTVSWQIAQSDTSGNTFNIGRYWTSGQSIGSTGTGNMRTNPWWLSYDPRNTGTTSGSVAPSHTSGTVTTGSIQWRYQRRVTAQDPSSNAQYGFGFNSGCGTPIAPLTTSRLTAKATIDVLVPSPYGGTMTNAGLIWAWRTISPNWRTLWSGVPADRPFDNNEVDNFKAVVILTDGENTSITNNNCGSWGSYPICRSPNTPYGYISDGLLGTTSSSSTAVTNMNAKVTEICNNIRASGTLIYAVMFDLPAGASSTRTLFQNCVGDPSRFFDTVDSAQLSAAFKTIAIDLARLRISQ